MSGEALGYARRRPVKGAAKTLLMMLGDNANGEGWAWPSRRLLAEHSGLAERHVQRTLIALAEGGHLVAFDVTDRHTGRTRSTAYWFPISAAEPTLRMVADYEREVGGRVTRRQFDGSAGEGDSQVSLPPAGEGDSQVSGRETPRSPPRETPRSPLEPSQEPLLKPPHRAGASGINLFDQARAAWPALGLKVGSPVEDRRAWDAEVAAGADPAELLAASRAYAADRSAWGASGKPLAFRNFLGRQRWTAFVGGEDAAGLGSEMPPIAFDGPAEVRQALIASFGAGPVGSYLDPSRWDPGRMAILPRTGSAAKWLHGPAAGELRALGVNVDQFQGVV